MSSNIDTSLLKASVSPTHETCLRRLLIMFIFIAPLLNNLQPKFFSLAIKLFTELYYMYSVTFLLMVTVNLINLSVFLSKHFVLKMSSSDLLFCLRNSHSLLVILYITILLVINKCCAILQCNFPDINLSVYFKVFCAICGGNSVSL